jgi:hypothetical protein
MWTEVFAGLSLVVSATALFVSYLAFRSAGPRLSGEADFGTTYYWPVGKRGVTLYVHVHNRGSGAITIDDLMLWTYPSEPTKDRELPSVGSTGWPLTWAADFPIRLEGHSGKQFSIPAVDIAKTWLTRPDLNYMEVNVNLATGLSLKLPVDTREIDGFDPEDLLTTEPETDDQK